MCTPAAEGKQLEHDATATVDVKGSDVRSEHRQINKSKRDWAQIPVGLPFTEMVEKAKNFTVTKLHPEQATVRQTVMTPTQVEKVGYTFADVEVEVVETEMVEEEVEVLETVLQDFQEEVHVRAPCPRLLCWHLRPCALGVRFAVRGTWPTV